MLRSQKSRVLGTFGVAILLVSGFWTPPVVASAEKTFRELVREWEATASQPLTDRLPILQAIGKLEGPEPGPFLVKLLGSGGTNKTNLHETVIWILADRGDVDALEAVVTKAFSILPEAHWWTVEKAWEGKVTNPEAISWLTEKGYRIVPTLEPRAQGIVIGLMAGTRDERAGEAAKKLLGHRKIRAPMKARLVDLVRIYKIDSTAKTVNKLFRFDNMDLQISVLRALRDFDAAQFSKTFKSALKNRHWQVRALAVDIFGGTHDPKVINQIKPLLEDAFPQVQIATIHALRQIGGKDVVQPLIDAMEGADGRIRDDIADALLWLIGEDLGPDHLSWSAWWQVNKEKAEVKGITREEFDKLREDSANAKTSTYYGLRVISDYVTFVVDVSGSMEEPYLAEAASDPEKEKEGGKKGGTSVSPRPGKGKGKGKGSSGKVERRKIEVAREQLSRAIRGLRDGVQFNLLSFDSLVNPWQNELIEMNEEVRDLALGYVQNLNPGGTTNIYDTLIKALEDDEVNTIYFLSDGAPTAGKITDPEEILRLVREANDIRKVKIHTIGFHLDPVAEKLMRQLAEQNFGSFVKK